jgi:mRNA-degrading endonuclease RelE of RelBE toxin-antitoxin system
VKWFVTLHSKVQKGIRKLPEDIRALAFALVKEIEKDGPYRSNWPNYGKLSDGRLHCHLKKGRPTYVAVWEVGDKKARIVEVKYVGTHEKAPY